MVKDIRVFFIVTGIIILIIYAIITRPTLNSNYEKANSNNTEQFDTTNKLTSTNKYIVKSISLEEMAQLYYNDYKSMIINDPKQAYSLIIGDNISEYEFNNYRNALMNEYYSYSYSKYSHYIDPTTKLEVYTITDNKGTVFSFKIHSVMQYEINIVL